MFKLKDCVTIYFLKLAIHRALAGAMYERGRDG